MTALRLFSLAAALGLLAACVPNSHRQHNTLVTTAAVSQAPDQDGRVTATGTFEGRSDHITTGTATVQRINGRWAIVLRDDFSFDGAPDPKVAFGSNGFQADAILAPLASNMGRQIYYVPAGLDVGDYNEVWLWCEQFNVPLGVARLRLTGA